MSLCIIKGIFLTVFLIYHKIKITFFARSYFFAVSSADKQEKLYGNFHINLIDVLKELSKFLISRQLDSKQFNLWVQCWFQQFSYCKRNVGTCSSGCIYAMGVRRKREEEHEFWYWVNKEAGDRLKMGFRGGNVLWGKAHNRILTSVSSQITHLISEYLKMFPFPIVGKSRFYKC